MYKISNIRHGISGFEADGEMEKYSTLTLIESDLNSLNNSFNVSYKYFITLLEIN